MKKTNKWATADRISDRIVDFINDELEQMRKSDNIEPLQILAGQLLALKALEQTMPLVMFPTSLQAVLIAVNSALSEIAEISR